MLRYLVLVVVALVGVPAAVGQVEICRAGQGSLPNVTIVEGCRWWPCDVQQGEDALVHIVFRTERPVAALRTRTLAFVQLGGLALSGEYPLGSANDTCRHLSNAACPLPAGALAHYTLRLPIDRNLPARTPVTFEVTVDEFRGDHHNRTLPVSQLPRPLLCVRIPLMVDYPPWVGNFTAKSDDTQESFPNLSLEPLEL